MNKQKRMPKECPTEDDMDRLKNETMKRIQQLTEGEEQQVNYTELRALLITRYLSLKASRTSTSDVMLLVKDGSDAITNPNDKIGFFSFLVNSIKNSV